MRILISLAILCGCDAPPIEADCDAASGAIEGSVVSGRTAEIVAADLTVRGVAHHTEGHVVRRVVVAGVAAKNEGFNFEQWSAVVPIGLLGGLPAAGTPDEVELAVVAVDGCERETALDTFTVAVDRTPGVRVERLAITVDFPGADEPGERFLPADGSASALLRLVANPDARGAVVTLGTNVGGFEGVAAGNLATLAGDGTADATATVFLTVDRAQDAIVTAQGKTIAAAPRAIDVAGPPTLLPSTAALAPGGSTSITVFTDGKVAACQATPAAGLVVTSGAADLMAVPAANDVNGDGRVDITVTAAAAVTAAATTTVSCVDRYGQASQGTFTVAP